MFDLRHIVETDFNKNHRGRSYDCAFAFGTFQKYIDLGLLYFTTDTVLIVYNVKNGVVEFHCVNGGSGSDLTHAINGLLEQLADSFEWAVTYYDNPRINELAKFSKYPVTVKKVDEGEDRTYEMSFDLRGV